jgi:molybdopterin-guanine dinucleotide biosynthesis protein B
VKASSIPIVSVVGNSGAGKTTFLEKLVPELKRRGFRVAVIKHDAHGFDMDRPGKDTYRLTEAGGDIVMIAGREKLALLEALDGERSLDELVTMVSDRVDIILTEGYRTAGKAKIEVSRQARGDHLVSQLAELVARVTDRECEVDVPHFGLEDAAGVAGMLEDHLALRRP